MTEQRAPLDDVAAGCDFGCTGDARKRVMGLTRHKISDCRNCKLEADPPIRPNRTIAVAILLGGTGNGRHVTATG